MTVLRRIEQIANDVAKDYTSVKLIPRGAGLFADGQLRGTVRFGIRSGNFLPVLTPRNTSTITLDTGTAENENTITISPVNPGFETVGAVLSIGPDRELIRVFDIDTDSGVVTAESDLIAQHAAGTQVNLFGVPIEVIGGWARAATTIQVRSSTIIAAGDSIAIETTVGLINSTVSTLITEATFLGTALDGRRNYEIDLARPTARSLENEEDILLRAQIAYESAAVPLDGPVVLDYVSGAFFGETAIDDYLNVKLLTALGDPVPGFTDFVPVGKNFPVVRARIPADAMVLWNPIIGQMRLRDTKFLALLQGGEFACTTELVPPFPPDSEWVVPVFASASALMRVRFYPNDWKDYTLVGGAVDRLQIGVTAGELASNRLEIAISSPVDDATIEFSDWLPTTAAASLVYQITSTAYGSDQWQSSSILFKPYFLRANDLSGRYDFSAYDQGVVYF